jgi:anti-sigma regulatory factor (Ser/Thr protein kinase)
MPKKLSKGIIRLIETKQYECELIIPSQGERLADTRAFIARTAKMCGFSKAKVFDIQVAVGEAVANAIEHGSPNGEEDTVNIVCCQEEKCLRIMIADQGTFRKAVPQPENKLSYRGHGILLMLALMDKVTIDESPNGTTVTLIKRYENHA